MGRRKKGGQGRKNVAARNQTSSTPAAKSKAKGQSFPVPGLSNLGNTCFFNAVMQNISQSHYFTATLAEHLGSPSYTVQLKLPEKEETRCLTVSDKPGPLTVKLHSFLRDMQEHGGSSLNPRPVFSEICNKAPRFSGYHQQDSQELLRYLLDSLRTEEINRIKRAVLFSFGVKEQKNAVKKLSDQDRQDIKGYGYQALLAHTFVDDVFGGVLNSTIECRECGDCTIIHETFLDLSLPVPEDKNMASLPCPTGHQTRSKNKYKGGGRNEETTDKGESLPLYSTTKKDPKPLSKYQLKREKTRLAKEAKKAAKFASKKTLSLQEFHKESEESELKEVEINESEEQTKYEDSGTAQSSNGCNSQPQTDKEVENTTGMPENAVARLAEDVQSLQVTESHSDSTDAQPTEYCDGDKVVAEVSPKEATSDDGIQQTPPHQCSEDQNEVEVQQHSALANEDGAAVKIVDMPVEEATPTKQTGVEALQVESDSLLACLKRFCSLELLTGDNKFACDVCTKRNTQTRLTSIAEQQNQPDPTSASNRDEAETGCSSPLQHDQPLSMGAENSMQDEASESPEVDTSSQADGQELQDEDNEDQENGLEEGSESLLISAENSPSSKGSDVVFCEATKQLLLCKAPLTLTLHLKRFIQQGKRLRKNNQHISFPTTLDLSPFCTSPSLQGLCDSGGKLLYSLYGVVEHSGGMQGGHYTAYVRVREPVAATNSHSCSEDTLPRDTAAIATSSSELAKSDVNHASSSSELAKSDVNRASSSSELAKSDANRASSSSSELAKSDANRASSSSSELAKSDVNHATSSSELAKSDVNHATSSSELAKSDVTMPHCHTASERTMTSVAAVSSHIDKDSGLLAAEGGDLHNSIPTHPPSKSSDVKLEPNPTNETSISSETTSPPSTSNKTSNDEPGRHRASVDKGLTFDLSSAQAGQWYYISDSHVRTASESEVMRCQAYVVFYEQLPFLRRST